MNKYPYIGYWEEAESMVLFAANREGFQIEALKNYSYEWSEHEYKNITREYLANTYGEVKSTEHAGFIIEMCNANEVEVNECASYLTRYFAVYGNELLFFRNETSASKFGGKQTTIPLPPKADKQDSREWPQVGDEVLICNIDPDSRVIDFNNEKVEVIAKTKNDRGMVLTLSHPSQGIGAIMLISKHVKKPKTPEEELRDDIESIIFKKHAELATSSHEVDLIIEMAKNSAEILLDEFEVKRKPQ